MYWLCTGLSVVLVCAALAAGGYVLYLAISFTVTKHTLLAKATKAADNFIVDETVEESAATGPYSQLTNEDVVNLYLREGGQGWYRDTAITDGDINILFMASLGLVCAVVLWGVGRATRYILGGI